VLRAARQSAQVYPFQGACQLCLTCSCAVRGTESKMVGAEGEAMELGAGEEPAVGAVGAETAAAATAAVAAIAPATQPRVYQLELLELAKKRNVTQSLLSCCLTACVWRWGLSGVAEGQGWSRRHHTTPPAHCLPMPIFLPVPPRPARSLPSWTPALARHLWRCSSSAIAWPSSVVRRPSQPQRQRSRRPQMVPLPPQPPLPPPQLLQLPLTLPAACPVGQQGATVWQCSWPRRLPWCCSRPRF
jgi:hypothetical protein